MPGLKLLGTLRLLSSSLLRIDRIKTPLSTARRAHYRTVNTKCTSRRLSTSGKAKVLGIETSCDDTGVAILDADGNILGESLFSQQELHIEFGGIIPPLARELHKENIERAVEAAFQNADLTMRDVDAVAVTNRPGLPLSLLIGVEKAKFLAKTYDKPLIPIHHMEAHALTVRMANKVNFPFLVLLISGGHSLIAVAQDVNKFLLLGTTLDDAPGEAFDKTARRLKLTNLDNYWKMGGGQAIELAALKGDPLAFSISEPLLQNRDCDFSFAGIKNSIKRCIEVEENKYGIKGDQVLPNVFDLCASVQFGVTKHLCRRVLRAMAYVEAEELLPADCRTLLVQREDWRYNYYSLPKSVLTILSHLQSQLGCLRGVACNAFIAKALKFVGSLHGFSVLIPPRHLCTDNGVMIAWNGVEKFSHGIDLQTSQESIDLVDIRWKCTLGEDIRSKVVSSSIKSPPLKLKDLLAACS